MSKKLIAFDLDGTLAPSKSLLPEKMVDLFNALLQKYEVCVISGGKYELFELQVLSQITKEEKLLKNLHLMPTSGTRYLKFENKRWELQYAEDFTKGQKEKIVKALADGLEESGFKAEKTYGESIEDRDSQITLSILGQDIVAQLGEEGVRIKEAWDPDSKKKFIIRDIVAKKIPEFNVRAAGATSIDVTRPGIDKAYGMNKLMVETGHKKQEILFMGDKIMPGGNDYAVEQMGIDCIAVRNWQDTAIAIRAILAVTD